MLVSSGQFRLGVAVTMLSVALALSAAADISIVTTLAVGAFVMAVDVWAQLIFTLLVVAAMKGKDDSGTNE